MTDGISIEKEDAEIAYEDVIVNDPDQKASLTDPKKPIFNYPTKDGRFISFMEAKVAFAPTPEEFDELRKSIIGVLGRNTTREFDDILRRLVTFLREQAYINLVRVPVTKRRKDISKFSAQIKRIVKTMGQNSFDLVREDIGYEIMKKMRENDQEDPLYTFYQRAHDVIEMCDAANEQLKGKKPQFTPNTMRQILAEELARELNKLGEEPKKYREGNYFKILQSVLEMIPCTVHKKRISISVPQDLFKIACDAIDAYPDKEPYSLLAFD